MPASELISCILVTRNRPHFVAQALKYFAAQTYTDSELIVVDDGEQPVEDLCQGRDRVRYFRTPGPMTTGAKMNYGIERAHGDLLQKLDDDDYYGPEFLRLGAERLPQTNRDHCMVSYCCYLIHIAGDETLRYSGHGWTSGNTLLFSREFWRPAPFRNLARGSDTAFLRDRTGSLYRVCAPEQCMVVRHGLNTWNSMKAGGTVEDRFRLCAPHNRTLREILSAEDCAFYDSLRFVSAANTSGATEK